MPEAPVLTKPSTESKDQFLVIKSDYIPETFIKTFKPVQTPDGNSNISQDELQKAKLRRGIIIKSIPVVPEDQNKVKQEALQPPILEPETKLPPPTLPPRPLKESLDNKNPIPSTNHGWKEFFMGAVPGFFARLSTKSVTTFAGINGWPYALLVGGVGGGMAGLARDFVTQYQSAKEIPSTKKILWTDQLLDQVQQNKPFDLAQLMKSSDRYGNVQVQAEAQSGLKAVMYKLGQVDKLRLGKAVLVGTALGVLGAATSSAVIDLLDWASDRLGDLQTPQIRIPGITPPSTQLPPDLAPPNVEYPPGNTPPGAQVPPGGGEIPPTTPPNVDQAKAATIKGLPEVRELPIR